MKLVLAWIILASELIAVNICKIVIILHVNYCQNARVLFSLHQITVARLLRCDASCLFWHCIWWCLVVVRVDQRPPASVCLVTAAVPPPPTPQPTLPPAVQLLQQSCHSRQQPVWNQWVWERPRGDTEGFRERCVWSWDTYNCLCGKNEWLALCISFCVRWQLVNSHLIKGYAVVVRDVVAQSVEPDAHRSGTYKVKGLSGRKGIFQHHKTLAVSANEPIRISILTLKCPL